MGWHQASGYQFGGQTFRSEHGNDELIIQLITSLSTLSSSLQEQSFCVLFPGARKRLEPCRPVLLSYISRQFMFIGCYLSCEAEKIGQVMKMELEER